MANRYAVTAIGDGASRSLKITIPARICRALGIEAGDVFWVDVETGRTVVLRYVRTGRAGDGSLKR